MGFFDWVGKALNKAAVAIAKGIRRFVVYTLLVFFFGMMVGMRLFEKGVQDNAMWLFSPLILAFLAYLYTEVAAIIFVFILFFFLFLFVA